MSQKVSIILPAYGRQASLNKACESVWACTETSGCDVELIVVDDASAIPLHLPKYPNLEIIRHDTNKGAAAARNTGIQGATGDLITFLDSDDIWLPNKLTHQIALFTELSQTHDPDLLVIGSGFYDPDRKTGRLRARLPMDASDTHLFASGCWFAPGSSVLMSPKVFDIVGPQDETMKRLEDLDWFIRFGQVGGKFFCTDTHDVVIRPSGNAPFDAVTTAVAQLTSKYGPSGSTPLAPRAWNRLSAYLALEKAVAYFGNRDFVPGAAELLKSVLRKPRLQPAVEDFWVESSEIPMEVQRVFATMLEMKD